MATTDSTVTTEAEEAALDAEVQEFLHKTVLFRGPDRESHRQREGR